MLCHKIQGCRCPGALYPHPISSDYSSLTCERIILPQGMTSGGSQGHWYWDWDWVFNPSIGSPCILQSSRKTFLATGPVGVMTDQAH